MMTSRQNMAIANKRIGRDFWKYYKYILLFLSFTFIASIVYNIIDGWFFTQTEMLIDKYITARMDEMYALEDPITFDELWADPQFVAATRIQSLVSVLQSVIPFIGTAIFALPMSAVFLSLVNQAPIGFKQSLRYVGKSIPLALLMMLKIFLWMLLFFIPGIIKAYSYSQCFYVRYENPDMSANDCIKRSCEIMRGRKGALFVLQICYIPYMILAGLVSGVADIILSMALGSVIASNGIIMIVYLVVISAISFAATSYVNVKMETSMAVFYVDAKRSWLSDVESELRYMHETGRDRSVFDSEDDTAGSGSTVTDDAYGDYSDPFETRQSNNNNNGNDDIFG